MKATIYRVMDGASHRVAGWGATEIEAETPSIGPVTERLNTYAHNEVLDFLAGLSPKLFVFPSDFPDLFEKLPHKTGELPVFSFLIESDVDTITSILEKADKKNEEGSTLLMVYVSGALCEKEALAYLHDALGWVKYIWDLVERAEAPVGTPAINIETDIGTYLYPD